MKIVKKIIAIMLVISTVLGFVGCGKSEQPEYIPLNFDEVSYDDFKMAMIFNIDEWDRVTEDSYSDGDVIAYGVEYPALSKIIFMEYDDEDDAYDYFEDCYEDFSFSEGEYNVDNSCMVLRENEGYIFIDTTDPEYIDDAFDSQSKRIIRVIYFKGSMVIDISYTRFDDDYPSYFIMHEEISMIQEIFDDLDFMPNPFIQLEEELREECKQELIDEFEEFYVEAESDSAVESDGEHFFFSVYELPTYENSISVSEFNNEAGASSSFETDFEYYENYYGSISSEYEDNTGYILFCDYDCTWKDRSGRTVGDLGTALVGSYFNGTSFINISFWRSDYYSGVSIDHCMYYIELFGYESFFELVMEVSQAELQNA